MSGTVALLSAGLTGVAVKRQHFSCFMWNIKCIWRITDDSAPFGMPMVLIEHLTLEQSIFLCHGLNYLPPIFDINFFCAIIWIGATTYRLRFIIFKSRTSCVSACCNLKQTDRGLNWNQTLAARGRILTSGVFSLTISRLLFQILP